MDDVSPRSALIRELWNFSILQSFCCVLDQLLNFLFGLVEQFIRVDEGFPSLGEGFADFDDHCAIADNIIVMNIFVVFVEFDGFVEESDIVVGDGGGVDNLGDIPF